jgi:hypothetical protein
MPGFESQSTSKNRVDADAANRDQGVLVRLDLPQLQVQIPVQMEAGLGARFYVNNAPVTTNTALTFTRENSASPWQPVAIRVEKDKYKTLNKILTKAEVESLPIGQNSRKLHWDLIEISRSVNLQVSVNVDDAFVTINNGAPAIANQTAPATVVLEFHRNDAGIPWSTNALKIAKEGYEFHPPSPAETTPEYDLNLTMEEAEALRGKLSVLDFQPMRQMPAPWQRVVVERGEVKLVITNVLSAITPMGMVSQYNPHFLDDGQMFIGDRFGVIPAPADSQGNGKPLPLILAAAKRAIRDGLPAEVIGSELVKVYPPPAKKVEQVTSVGATQDIYDFQPYVTSDGKYIYFSSNRSDDGQYHIFRIRADASRYLEEITHPQPGIDMEPSVYTDHDGKNRLAFTRYPVKAALHAQPRIMVQTSEGGFAQVGDPGTQPTWSHDGTKIAYVSTKGKICIMNPEDGASIELDSGANPAWLPGDKQVVFSKQTSGNYSLCIMDVDGANALNPIPDNSSFYSFPMVSFDDQKTYIYFISNRQIQRRGDPKCWGLYFVDWKQ